MPAEFQKRGIWQRVFRASLASVPAFSFVLLFDGGVVQAVLGFALCSCIAIAVGDAILLYVLPVTTFAVGGMAIWFWGFLDSNYSISGQLFSIFLGTIFLILLLGARKHGRQSIGYPESVTAAVLGLLSMPFAAHVQTEPVSALTKLFQFSGEDSAAWLYAMSSSISGGDLRIIPTSSQSGGTVTGSLLTGSRWMIDTVKSDSHSVLGTPGVLVSIYMVVSFVAAVIGALTAIRLSNSSKVMDSVGVGVVSGVGTLAFFLGFLRLGHLSASVAALCLLGTFSLVVLDAQRKENQSRYFLVLSIIVLLSLGQSWFVFQSISVGVALIFFASWAKGRLEQKLMFSPSALIKPISVALVVCVFVYYYFSSFLRLLFDFETVKYQIALDGAYPTVREITAAAIFLIIGAGLFHFVDDVPAKKSIASQMLTYMFAILLVINLGLFLLGYLIEPYYPQYGPFKFLYMSTAASFPIAVGYFSKWTIQKSSSSMKTAVVMAAFLFAFVSFGAPIQYLGSVIDTAKEKLPWANQLVQEIQSDQDRVVVCLDSSEGNSFDDETYLCSRAAIGLQGVNDSEYFIWTAANICQIQPSQFESDLFGDDFYNRLTILVTDSDRYTSGGSCQGKGWGGDQYEMGWLSDTNWSLVRVVGYDGKEVLTP
jgi:hypothetical protein